MHWNLWKSDDHASIPMMDFEVNYWPMKASWQQSKQRATESKWSKRIFFSRKKFRSKVSNSQTTTTTTTTITTIGRKTVALPSVSGLPLTTTTMSTLTSTRSNPSTPMEPTSSHSSSSSSSSNLILLRRTRSPNQSSSVVVVPRQTSDHCKGTSHVSTRPNSMI